jgi:hypothetical protein
LTDSSKVDRANAQFNKLQRAEDGKKAMSEYETDRIAVIAKTERLRTLRVARDAAGQAAPAEEPVATAKKPGRKKKATPATLSSWLNNQQGSGRRS